MRKSRGSSNRTGSSSRSSVSLSYVSLFLLLLISALLGCFLSLTVASTAIPSLQNAAYAFIPSATSLKSKIEGTTTITLLQAKPGSNGSSNDQNKDMILQHLDNNTLATLLLMGQGPPSFRRDTKEPWTVIFEPGQLKNITNAQALSRCYADTTVYKNHFRTQSQFKFAVSDEHKLMYILLPKSGSSTSRYMMMAKFGSVQRSIPKLTEFVLAQNYTLFTFVRDPLSRFYSQYDESYSQTGPWNSKRKHPFPFLHENLPTYQAYEEVFCPPETRPNKNPKICTFLPSKENGTLAARFERLVREYDGRNPYDIHLHLQVPMMSYPETGLAYPVKEIYDTTVAKEGWDFLANRHGVDLSVDKINKDAGKVIKGRSYPRRYDIKFVSNSTKQRICELALLDYCCLNLPLPPPCQDLHCTLSYVPKHGRLQIEPYTFPQSAKTSG